MLQHHLQRAWSPASCHLIALLTRTLTSLYLCVIVVGLCIVASSTPLWAYGPNLLMNPKFESGIGGWNPNSGASCPPEWIPSDSDGSIASGSVKLTCAEISQCVPIVGGTSYVAAVRAWIPSGSHAESLAFVAASWHKTSNCSDDSNGAVTSFAISEQGKWVDLVTTSVAPQSALSVRFSLFRSSPHDSPPPTSVYFDNAFFGTGTCAPTSTRLCLNEGRFQVEVTWTTRDGTRGLGMAVPFAGDSGSFWFFSPTNIELDVKVLNACVPSLGNKYWVFAAGLTDVNVELTVTDTKTGNVRIYTNSQGSVFQPITDTKAFSCP